MIREGAMPLVSGRQGPGGHRSEGAGYLPFTTQARLEAALNSLLAILAGIALDRRIVEQDTRQLMEWLHQNEPLSVHHPYNEFFPALHAALMDDILDESEQQDMFWLINQLKSMAYCEATTADMQCLQGVLAGITAHGAITEAQLLRARDWLAEREPLRTIWPYAEVDRLITAVMTDGKLDAGEHALLLCYLGEFSEILIPAAVSRPEHVSLRGLCEPHPELRFEGSIFCFTGEFERHTHYELMDMVNTRGGTTSPSVSRATDYLAIGGQGNPCWEFAAYGRKIEQAQELRAAGSRILLISESDFLEAIG